MPRISSKKEEKIKESVLNLLFQNSPKALFTAKIAMEIARDEEYVKKLLSELEQKGFVVAIKKNSKGRDYKRRVRWRLDTKVYDAYKKLSDQSLRVAADSKML
ncbi:MAG: hypothetical protein K6T16_01485 [Candidatus Pacearchaeota archaeon]|nr:hypothetical protein [Candidatus Pacearchaeota archaeon]